MLHLRELPVGVGAVTVHGPAPEVCELALLARPPELVLALPEGAGLGVAPLRLAQGSVASGANLGRAKRGFMKDCAFAVRNLRIYPVNAPFVRSHLEGVDDFNVPNPVVLLLGVGDDDAAGVAFGEGGGGRGGEDSRRARLGGLEDGVDGAEHGGCDNDERNELLETAAESAAESAVAAGRCTGTLSPTFGSAQFMAAVKATLAALDAAWAWLEALRAELAEVSEEAGARAI